MIPAAARALIETWRLGFVATVDAEGRPHVSPKGTFLVLDDILAFGEIRSPGTLANLAVRPELEVNFIDVLARKGLRVRGAAAIKDRGAPGFDARLPAFAAIWGDDFAARINAVVEITPERIQPVTSPIYDDGAEEATIRADYLTRIREAYEAAT